MLKKIFRGSFISLMGSIILTGIAIASQLFGEEGRRGRNGEYGEQGKPGKNLTILVDGKPATYDVKGSDGTVGEDGSPGGDARACRAPKRPAYSIVGASGGDGGNGGNGGNGGDGGNVSIFYTKEGDLKTIKLDNSGGEAAKAGRGAEGGVGCECRETRWSINYCAWQLFKKSTTNVNAKWVIDSEQLIACTGVQSIDEQYHYPSLPAEYENSGWNYKWVYQGVSKTENFSCRSGENGNHGSNGYAGRDGNYGQVTLIPRTDIPKEKISYYAPLSNLIANKIELVKNIWVKKQGLRDLLHPSSNVTDTYTYLQSTARLNYRIDWKASATPAELGINDTEVGAEITLQGLTAMLDFNVPGTLEYQITKPQSNLNILTVTGGFSPSRVKSFKVNGIANIGDKQNQLVLIDEGNVRELLKDMSIEVECFTKQSASGITVSNEYQKRHTFTFNIPPKNPPSLGANVNKNVYQLDLNRFFSPWLKPGYDVQYEIKITQTTKSGAVYNQSQQFQFQVPQ